MEAWFLETGVYLLDVAMVALIGVLLVYRGLWGDRSKGRVRCPKCWYDMRGTVPKLECPECGHDARQERRLHNTRRRWRRTVVGVVLVLLSVYPLVIVGGYWREQAVMRKYDIAPTTGSGLVSPGARTGSIGPAWLVKRLSDDLGRFFDRKFKLIVDGPAQLAACRSLPHLIRVTASGASITDAGLIHLKGLSNLSHLYLLDTHVTDAGLIHLKGLSNLRHIYLSGTRVTGAELVHLKGLSNLRYLDLTHPPVTDTGVAELQQALPNVSISR
jgi:hypothetical protein